MNDLSKVVDKLLAQGLLALRGTCVMPRLVNSDYSNLAAQQGASIDVPIPSAIKAQAVTPGATSQDTGDISPVSATIKLDRWMEAPFYLTDKDLMEANRGVIPMQASEAVKAIANDVNATLLGLGRKFYGMVGTPGTTPFSTVVGTTLAVSVRALYRLSVPSAATSKSVPAFTVPACSAVATGTFPAISALSPSVST